MSTEHAKNLDLMRAGYHVDSKKRIAALDAAIAALAATGKQQVGEVQGDRTQLVALIVRNCCESEPSHPDNPDTVCINVNDLEAIVSAQLEAVVMEDDPIPALAARQPVGHTIETARALGERTVASVKLIGTLADLPEHVQKVIQSYAGFCVRSALLHQGGQLPAALQEVEQKS